MIKMGGNLTSGGGKELRGEGEKGKGLISARYAAHRPPVVPVVVVGRVNIGSCEVQVVSVVAIVDRTRPIVRIRP